MNLLDRYCSNIDALDYDDFSKNTKINIPENFNFGYDVVMTRERKKLLLLEN